MELQNITPVVLSLNEAPNIERTLERLTWAKRVLLLDSGSTDATLELAARFPNVDARYRKFDGLASQWSHALEQSGIDTEWVLALDADYILGEGFVDELRALTPGPQQHGFAASFVYCVEGIALRGSLYPPVTVLYRRRHAHYRQDGHTQRIVVDGEVGALKTRIAHDDRKPLSRWLASQAGYAKLEAQKILSTPPSELSWPDRVRLLPGVAPVAAAIYAGLVRRCLLDGRAGVAYVAQRAIAESILMLELLQQRAQDD
jgi:glycosyltransferase involved in cell wall biosynthesis